MVGPETTAGVRTVWGRADAGVACDKFHPKTRTRGPKVAAKRFFFVLRDVVMEVAPVGNDGRCFARASEPVSISISFRITEVGISRY